MRRIQTKGNSCCAVLNGSVLSNYLQPSRLFCPWGFSRQEYCCGLPYCPLGGLPNSRIEPRSPTFQVDSLLSEPIGKSKNTGVGNLSLLQGDFLTQNQTRVSYIAGRFFTSWAIRGVLNHCHRAQTHKHRMQRSGNKSWKNIKKKEGVVPWVVRGDFWGCSAWRGHSSQEESTWEGCVGKGTEEGLRGCDGMLTSMRNHDQGEEQGAMDCLEAWRCIDYISPSKMSLL